MNRKEFNNFFKYYSKNVDNASRQFFWKLSDSIILGIIKKNISQNLDSRKIIMDAGGGTGRWTCELSKIYKSSFILYDLSKDMLLQAAKNIKKAGIENRAMIIKGDLTNIKKVKDNSVDHIISIYNPISFVRRKEKVVSEMFRILKKNGKIIIMGQGYFNALASKINNFFVSKEELLKIEKRYIVKWNSNTPRLNLFSKESLEKILKKAGFRLIKSYGVPIFVQPGPKDFDPKNIKKSKISKALENFDFFKAVLNLEMRYNFYPQLVNRGMNIISIAMK